jgi:uncharacterized protein YndB with AHSA1/START domain
MAGRDELVISRDFAAPRDLVWKAYTEPEHLNRWWGPKGMPTTTVKFDLRVGGMFLYRMQRPQGDMWGKFVYKEIKAPEKLVFVNSFSSEQAEVTRAPFGGPWANWPLEIHNTVTFTQVGIGTRLELRSKPLNANDHEMQVFREMQDDVRAGTNATFDQLEQHLKEQTMTTKNANTFQLSFPSDTEIKMTRVFDAPKRLVFLAHSKAEHMKRWWGPRSLEITQCDIDFRVGGKWRIVHRDAQGTEYGLKGEFKEIVQDKKITWTFEFDGMPGHVSVETLTLDEKDGKTTLTAISKYDSKEDRDGMAQSGMEQGARETWDRLEELVATLK